MPSRESLPQFLQAYLPEHQPDVPQLFSVFAIDSTDSRQSLPYGRRDFYQITLYTSGTKYLTYAGQTMQVSSPALLFYNPLEPYACAVSPPLTGFCCLFTADFLYGPGCTAPAHESPLFQLGASPFFKLTVEQGVFFAQLFQQLLNEVDSTYRYKKDLLRTHLQLLLHEALRRQPDRLPLAEPTAAGRLTTQFLHLLEAQFPIHSPARPLSLHTAEAFAVQLAVHSNYLSRVLREVTGRPTSAHLAGRITQEARMLLHHTDWAVAAIADALGFADPTYFNHFFRQHAGISPTAFRQQAGSLPGQVK